MGTSNGSMDNLRVNTAAPAGAGEGSGAHASEAQCVRIRPILALLTDSPPRLARKCAPDCGAARTHAKTTCTAPIRT